MAQGKYSEKLASEIIARIAEGLSVPQIASLEGMPSRRAIFNWLANPKHESFAHRYAVACTQRAEALVEQALEIARSTLERTQDREAKVDKSEVAAARLLADMLLKRAAHLEPSRYGNLLRQEHSGPDKEPLVLNIVRFGDLPPEERGTPWRPEK